MCLENNLMQSINGIEKSRNLHERRRNLCTDNHDKKIVRTKNKYHRHRLRQYRRRQTIRFESLSYCTSFVIHAFIKYLESGYVSSEERNKNNLEQEAIIQDIPLIDASKGNANSDKRKGEALILDPGSEEELVILPSNVSAKDIVLRRCQQTYYLPFEKCYPNTILKNCHKIGEGVYGEVFLFRNLDGGTSVMKIIPIEGDQMVNGEKQKKFDEILTEIIIAGELSKLKTNKNNVTNSFCEVRNIKCVQGKYPNRLIDLWELYDEDCGSENDSPVIFDEEQIYIVLELSNGGKDLEAFIFNDALQAFSTFKQTVCALAVAENALQFEHRDLHWGNVLISKVNDDKCSTFTLNGRKIVLPTDGVEVSIIDFTMSRITYDGANVFNDLALDSDIFSTNGDYQFEIYRMMQKTNGNDWQHFEPHTNLLWLHYLLDKMINGLRYKVIISKAHKRYLEQLRDLKQDILNYKSVTEYVESNYL